MNGFQSNFVVMVSKNKYVILIQQYNMCDLPTNLSPNIMNKEKILFLPLVLVLRVRTPLGLNMWFWVQLPSLYLFVCCCVIVLWHLLVQSLLILILVLGCCWKCSDGWIQTRDNDLIALKAWGSCCEGYGWAYILAISHW